MDEKLSMEVEKGGWAYVRRESLSPRLAAGVQETVRFLMPTGSLVSGLLR